jgi:hypothetical protein
MDWIAGNNLYKSSPYTRGGSREKGGGGNEIHAPCACGYSVDNTSEMFYSDSCMKFWKVMYRLFHGKVLI